MNYATLIKDAGYIFSSFPYELMYNMDMNFIDVKFLVMFEDSLSPTLFTWCVHVACVHVTFFGILPLL